MSPCMPAETLHTRKAVMHPFPGAAPHSAVQRQPFPPCPVSWAAAEYRESPETNEALKGPVLELLASAGLQEDCPFDEQQAAAPGATSPLPWPAGLLLVTGTCFQRKAAGVLRSPPSDFLANICWACLQARRRGCWAQRMPTPSAQRHLPSMPPGCTSICRWGLRRSKILVGGSRGLLLQRASCPGGLGCLSFSEQRRTAVAPRCACLSHSPPHSLSLLRRWWRTASSPRACTCWASRPRRIRRRSTSQASAALHMPAMDSWPRPAAASLLRAARLAVAGPRPAVSDGPLTWHSRPPQPQGPPDATSTLRSRPDCSLLWRRLAARGCRGRGRGASWRERGRAACPAGPHLPPASRQHQRQVC